jgi:hypothetical protein
VAAVTKLGTETFTTLAGTKFLDATPAVGDLIVIVAVNTGTTTATAPTDNNSDGLGTYSQAVTCLFGTSTHIGALWIRDALIGSASNTRFTNNSSSNNGGGLVVLKVTGMTNVGATAEYASGRAENQSAGTPAPGGGFAVTEYPVISVVMSATNPPGLTPRSGYTTLCNTGYSTPTCGVQVIAIDSGEASGTITWGSASSTAYGTFATRLDSSGGASGNAPRSRFLQMLRNA